VWAAANDNLDVVGAFGVTVSKLTTLRSALMILKRRELQRGNDDVA
jgi:hypothetical protein